MAQTGNSDYISTIMEIQSHKRRSFCVLILPSLAAFFLRADSLCASPALPVINTNNVANVVDFGAVGDGVTTNTAAIQNAINKAAMGGTTNGAAGGTVEFPAGIFLCGRLLWQTRSTCSSTAARFCGCCRLANIPSHGSPTPRNIISSRIILFQDRICTILKSAVQAGFKDRANRGGRGRTQITPSGRS